MAIQAERIRNLVWELPELHTWPEVESIFTFEDNRVPWPWQLPAIGCEAVGGSADVALPAVAAMGCLQRSGIIIDDILDEEADGLYIEMGAGRAANLTMALQGAASVLLAQCAVSDRQRRAAQMALNQVALDTAAGQELDAQNLWGEENYWRVIRAKSAPVYAQGLRMGAILGGADSSVEQNLYEIGVLYGEIIQIHDDLDDAFKIPANPDWVQRRNNLLILYGTTADYAERDRFIELCEQIEDDANLEEAQLILVRSGAISYGIYQAMQREQRASALLDQTPLVNPALIANLFVNQRTPLVEFLQTTGIEIPEALFAMPVS